MDATPEVMFARNWSFSEETLEELRARYSGFGHELYEIIRDEIPAAFAQLRFYRSDLHQTGDSFAVCGLDRPFGIQLDPDIEVIVLGSEEARTEIGSWATSPYEDAINFIRQHFIDENGDPVAAPNP